MKRLPVLSEVQTREVPCNGCTTCCQSGLVMLYPERGDDVSSYKTVKVNGWTVLQRAAHGDCIYLNRKTGCTIYRRRPAFCRVFDCRSVVDDLKKSGHLTDAVLQGKLRMDVVRRAAELGLSEDSSCAKQSS